MACEEDIQKFHDDGYLILPNFLSDEDVNALKTECRQLVDDMNPEDHRSCSFSTDDKKRHTDDYFITSGDKIRFFFEVGAQGENGELIVDKHDSLNKIGHALHAYSPEFKRVTFSKNIQDVARSLGFVKPCVCQSMYIFKPPNIGGKVTPHQDSTFLYTTPMKVLGYWIALEDCTLDNGCLWFIPGSHKAGLHDNRRMIRNANKVNAEDECHIMTAPVVEYDDQKFISGEVKKGTLVLIHGEVAHKSGPNKSTISRHIYTFHIIETHETEWSKQNWLQPSEQLGFVPLYTET